MTHDQFEYQLVAATLEDGSLTILSFVTHSWSTKGDVGEYRCEATDDAIAAELAKLPTPAPVASWRRIEPGDLPPTREHRIAWKDTGEAIIVDPSLVPRREVPKSLIVSRLFEVGLLTAASVALNSNLYARERWYAPDKPCVYADDKETLDLLTAIGANPEEILAP